MHDTSFQYLNKLADISISLSSEDDLLTLLRKILEEGQNIACCEFAVVANLIASQFEIQQALGRSQKLGQTVYVDFG